MKLRTLALAAVLAIPGVASAQEVTSQAPLTSPGFVQLDRFDGNSRVGAEFSYLLYDDDSFDGTALRFDIHGHYVDRKSGFGGYLQLPISYGSVDVPIVGTESATAVGNLELGGLYMKQVANVVGIVGRVGLVLPTSSDDSDKIAALNIAAPARITDAVLALPKGTALRLSVSPIIRAGKLFARGDLGVDVILDEADGFDADNAIRFGAGVGYDGGGFAVGADLALLSSNESQTNISLFARAIAGPITPYLALVFPVSGDVGDALTMAFTFGLEARLN